MELTFTDIEVKDGTLDINPLIAVENNASISGFFHSIANGCTTIPKCSHHGVFR